MGIKSKNKLSAPVIALLVCGAGIVSCIVLYYFVDYFLNGAFVDWFEKYYTVTEANYSAEAGGYTLVRRPLYSNLKVLLFWIFTCSVVFWLSMILAVSYLHAKMSVRKSVTRISETIRDFMHSEKDAAELFPKEYAEISAQMVEIKSTAQRHEQILKEEAARKNDLITYLAHDLKTPLTSVIGYLSLLDEVEDMPAKQRAKYVHITLEKAGRLEKLINEFFEITRYNLQHIELEKESINLCHMLVQMTDEFYPLLQAHGNTTELRVDESAVIYGDAEKLARVFNNVLKNAVAYSYPDTTIKIWAEQTDMAVRIYVRNRGKTIPPHRLETIFEKFFRLDEARTSNTGGAGLGLAIAREIITLHGGTITADSLDETTTFHITLPLAD